MPDLALAGDWMPVRLFLNRGGKFQSWNPPIRPTAENGQNSSSPSRFHDLIGWWNSLGAGDFDADGRMDIVAGNWGRNIGQNHFPYQKNANGENNPPFPRRLYFESRPAMGKRLLEADYDRELADWMPKRDWMTLGAVFPSILKKYRSYTAFGQARVAEILASDSFPPMQFIEASVFDSMVFLNRGDFFEARPLPIEAQFAPVFGLDTGDVNNDGRVDVVLTQNIWSLAGTDGRQDAGNALLLLGQGDGNFHAVPPRVSGLAVYGQGRGLALCDYDHDGRLDLAAAQNNGTTRLYHNQIERSGLRVQLKGAPNNRAAVGAQVRLTFADNPPGPIHEIRLGNGYLSQNPSAVVLGSSQPPSGNEIRWTNGIVEQIALSSDIREISPTIPNH